MRGLRLTRNQWQVLSTAIIHIAEAIILFSLAAFFVPEALNLSKDFSRITAFGFLISGLTILVAGVILAKKGK